MPPRYYATIAVYFTPLESLADAMRVFDDFHAMLLMLLYAAAGYAAFVMPPRRYADTMLNINRQEEDRNT